MAAGREAARLLDRDDVDSADLRVTGEQVGSDLAKRSRDLAVQVGLPGVAGLEGVEDAVAGVTDLERVPGHSALLGNRELAAGPQERGQFLALAWRGLQLRENPQSNGHCLLSFPDARTGCQFRCRADRAR